MNDIFQIDPEALVKHSPIVDQTTINSIESIFHADVVDPAAERLLQDFCDFFIWHDSIRYPIVLTEADHAKADTLVVPALLARLQSEDSSAVEQHIRTLPEPVSMQSDYVDEAFSSFASYLENNRNQVSHFLRLHATSRVVTQVDSRFQSPRRFVFDAHTLEGNPRMSQVNERTGINPDNVLYLFDLVLKYYVYGAVAGDGAYYMSHPIRENQNFPFRKTSNLRPARVPLRLGRHLTPFAKQLTIDDFVGLLFQCRQAVRDLHMVGLAPGAIEGDARRELAARISLPPRLRNQAKVLGLLTAFVGGLGAFTVLGPPAAALGAALGVASALWSGRLPRGAADAQWLRWAIQWDVETDEA